MGGSEGLKRGLWTEEEDRILIEHVEVHGKGKWNRVAKITGLKRCGKSCRLRWMNYLRPEIKRGAFCNEEDELIIRLHKLLGNRWSLIAGRVPGRTDNQVKNHWNTHLKKRIFCAKNSIESNEVLVKVMDRVGSNGSESEENNSVSCRQEMNNAAQKIVVDEKTKCITQEENVNGEEEGLESLFWKWSNDCTDGSLMELNIDDPWDWDEPGGGPFLM